MIKYLIYTNTDIVHATTISAEDLYDCIIEPMRKACNGSVLQIPIDKHKSDYYMLNGMPTLITNEIIGLRRQSAFRGKLTFNRDDTDEAVNFKIDSYFNGTVDVIQWKLDNYYYIRKFFYPPMEEYLDAVAKGDQVQIDNYKSSCLAVKARFPKE
jgi:hypothetical protein